MIDAGSAGILARPILIQSNSAVSSLTEFALALSLLKTSEENW